MSDPASTLELALPHLLDGRYQLTAKIGEGGMGRVYAGVEVGTSQRIAVKVLSPKWAANAEYVARFEREAAVMGSIRHPNVIALHALGRTGGVPYLVMPYLEGGSLKELIVPWLEPARALPLFEQLCAGVAALHLRGIVHRDLKPANVFVSPEGRLTVLDLGIARSADSKLTRTGVIFGTPNYMAPEQIAGDRIDARADIYALGVLLFKMLSGQLIFTAKNDHHLMVAHLTQRPPDLSAIVPELPPELDAVLHRALAKAPEERFWAAQELYREVAKCFPEIASVRAFELGQEELEKVTRTHPRFERVDPVAPAPALAPEPATAHDGPAQPLEPAPALEREPSTAHDGPAQPLEPAPALEREPSTAHDGPEKPQPAPSLLPETPTRTTGGRMQKRTRDRLLVATAAAASLLIGALILAFWPERGTGDPRGALEPLPATVLPLADAPPQLNAQESTNSEVSARRSQYTSVDLPEPPPRPKAGQGGAMPPRNVKRLTDRAAWRNLAQLEAGELHIEVTGGGKLIPAKVELDGEYVGDAPLATKVTKGSHQLRVRFAPYPPTVFTTEVQVGAHHRIEIDLWPPEG